MSYLYRFEKITAMRRNKFKEAFLHQKICQCNFVTKPIGLNHIVEICLVQGIK